ncbi:serine protease [Williamsoniiplasma luminosum]|uniref:Serine protease n=2 Tax=Williamsoniiplasma luminosum TaxID=214888 RepID=A0A2K8NUT2_9MOLU|nr:S8 family serine peptidase [Williamsoniiplasma luminosum]ATZ17524.1 serine protease [Williamsoniiplasma luminosum]
MSKIIIYSQPKTKLNKFTGRKFSFEKWNYDMKKTINDSIESLKNIKKYFLDFQEFAEFPVTVSYKRVVPKTFRIQAILVNHEFSGPNQIGSKYIFNRNNKLERIDVIYSLSISDLDKTIDNMCEVEDFILKNPIFQKEVTEITNSNQKAEEKNQKIKELITLKYSSLKTMHKKLLDDFVNILELKINLIEPFEKTPIFSFLDLKINNFNKIIDLLLDNGIDISEESLIASEFWNIDIEKVNQIVTKYPFIFSQTMNDIEIDLDVQEFIQSSKVELPIIKNEDINKTVIGLIDSRVKYIDEWWEQKFIESQYDMLEIHQNEDLDHGTQVASIISLNDFINEEKDGLGIFRVRSFNVLPKGRILTSMLMRKIHKIISENYHEIKIWNISLGSEKSYNELIITPFGKLIDKLQFEFGVQIVTSAGNSENRNLSAPADSLTSISVGSLYKSRTTGKVLEWERSGSGKIFGMYQKPNCYEFGNNRGNPYWGGPIVHSLPGLSENLKIENGTSFSTPLVTRKVAYLIENFKISPQSARAVINYLSKSNSHGIPDLEILKGENDIFIFIEGFIDTKGKYEIDVNLPINSSNKTEFSASYSVCYNIPNEIEIGDEYSPLDISFRLAQKNGSSRSNILSPISKKDSVDADEKALKEYFGKYNPNTVVFDKNFSENNPISLKSKESFSFVVERMDLLNHGIPSVEYGIMVHLKEIAENSLINFEELNFENIISIFNYGDIDIDIEL